MNTWLVNIIVYSKVRLTARVVNKVARVCFCTLTCTFVKDSRATTAIGLET
jgi:hypothetical protein